MKFLSFEHKGKTSFGCFEDNAIADLGTVLGDGYRSLKAVVVGEGEGAEGGVDLGLVPQALAVGVASESVQPFLREKESHESFPSILFPQPA